MTITIEHTISMGHRLPSYAGICNSPHGHNVRVVATINPRGLFLDFKGASATLGAVLADLDHAMVLVHTDPLLPVLRGMGFRAVALSTEPTTEALAQLVLSELHAALCDVADVASVTVHETARYAATATDLFAGGVYRVTQEVSA